jgi:hypothetical protein
MTLILASRPNVYTGSPLDRASERRDDVAWVLAAFRAPGTLIAPVWRARNLMRGVAEGKPEAVFIDSVVADALHLADGPWAFLGIQDGVSVFTIDVSAAEDPLALLPARGGGAAGADGGVHPGTCPRADALAQPPPFLRCLWWGVRTAQRRQRSTLYAVRQFAFSPHRSSGDHAGPSR